MQDLHPYFALNHFADRQPAVPYEPHQWGAVIQAIRAQDGEGFDEVDIVILGCGEQRGAGLDAPSSAPDAVREELYQLYNWHAHLRVGDAGDIATGSAVNDTRAALRLVLHELHKAGKMVILIGGSHDLTLEMYEAFRQEKQAINATIADMRIDLEESETVTHSSYLLDMLTGEPNYLRHYTHIGFQSYHVNPHMLETLDKLRFDFIRLGRASEDMDEAEPAIRASELFSMDMNVVRWSDAPANVHGSPNGFSGTEACTLTRYAGMATDLRMIGLFGYHPKHDTHAMTARLMAQMIWYFLDGYNVRQREAPLTDSDEYRHFHVRFTSNDTTFLKSKRTGRWWMQLPDTRFIPCTYADYQTATQDEIPERWLREQERVV